MKKNFKIKNKHCSELLQKPNVVGVGVGLREKEGQYTGETAMVVFVQKKVPRAALRETEIVPRSLGGAPVDVVEIGEVRLLSEEGEEAQLNSRRLAERLKRYRPAPGGVSIGHYKITAGTLGVAVRDRQTKATLALSNNHVLANSSAGKDGRAAPGDPVLQPGFFDGGRADQDVIGHLERFVPMLRTFQRPSCVTAAFWENAANHFLSLYLPHYRVTLMRQYNGGNLADAAVARPVREEYLSPEILGIGVLSGRGEAALGSEVRFSGRTSGLQQGRVLAKDVRLYVQITPQEKVLFVDQLVVSAVSRPGDSGSILVDHKNRAVGLLFAGSDKASICNRIENVCTLLGVEI